MPSFFKGKLQTPQIIAVSPEHHESIINYFEENEFFKTDFVFFKNQLNNDSSDNFFIQNNLKELLVNCLEEQFQEILTFRN